MLASAFLAVAAAAERARNPGPAGQIPLTRNEIASLFTSLIIKPADERPHRLRWSAWRRRHQHRAQAMPLPAASPKTHEDHDLRLEY